MDAFLKIVGCTISALTAPTERPALAYIPWLCLEFSDGTKAMISPIETQTKPDEYPSLSIETTIVNRFTLVHRWPNGPLVPNRSIAHLDHLLGKQVRDVQWIDSWNDGIPSLVQIHLDSGHTFNVAHGRSPMWIDVTVTPPSNANAT